MRCAYDNEFDKYTIIANSEASGYPATNIQDISLIKVTRSTGDTSETWKIDAGVGETIQMTCAAIGGHNFTSGATIKFQGNATDSWGSPTVDETLTYAAGNIIKFFTGGTLRFWQFKVEDAANPDTYIEIGRLSAGTYLDLAGVIGKDFPEEHISTAEKEHTVTGQVYGDKGIIYKLYSFLLSYVTNTQKANLITMFDEVDIIKPIFFVADENDLTKILPLYATLNDNFVFNHIVGYVWSTTLALREAK